MQWLWIRCKEHDSPGSAFLAKIEEIGATYFLVTLDRNAIVSFIVEMDAAVCREIYELLAGGRFREEQENVSSPWNTIMLEFKKRYDKEAYFAQCTRDLEKNWHLGIPLVESATSSKDWHGADTLLFKTFAFCFNHYPKSDWFPETSLLSLNMRYQPEGEATKNILKLLKIWGEVSDQLGNRERAVASRLQAVLADHSDDIDAVISAFTTLRKEHEVPILDTLFRQWQDETAIKSFNRYYGKQISADTWVHWAIVAQVEGEKGTARFREKLDTWFCGLSESGDEFTKHWDELALLTVDLSTGSHRNCYSGLFVTAFKNSNTSTSLDKSRSFFVKRLCLTETVEKAFEIWKKHFSRIIPDPSTSASDYLRPVAWVKVLFDLNPDAYTGLVGQWKVNHRRRINLWKTMRNAKLPVD